MKRATKAMRSISINGGYAGIHSLDLKQRYGESLRQKAGATRMWIQPPGTPTVGEAYLRAFRSTGDKVFLDAAREVGGALAWAQNRHGGWTYLEDVAKVSKDFSREKRGDGRCVFDDNTSQAALSFLMNLDCDLDEAWLDEAVERGIGMMLSAQCDNGAWQQAYPQARGYSKDYTFNDNAMNDCLRVMLEAWAHYGDERCLKSAKRCGEFIIASQIDEPQAGWAQQYDEDLKPSWARSFEPPGVCSAVTARNIRTLVDLYLKTRDERFLEPIPAAIEWLARSPIRKNVWARLYEPKTNRPIYGDRDSKVHYTLEEISEERRGGYSWQSNYGIPGVIALYHEIKRLGADAYLDKQTKARAEAERNRSGGNAPRARSMIAGLNESGLWVEKGWIKTNVFVAKMRVLSDYMAASGGQAE